MSHIIHRHGMDEPTALEVEAALIDAYPEAHNIASEHYSDERGVMHAQQIIEQYQAEEIEFSHNVLMINVNRTSTEAYNVYEAVRFAWKLDVNRARKADIILALQQGIVIGVFTPNEWLEATQVNFPDRYDRPGRRGFIGAEASDEIKDLYMRKRLPKDMRKKGAANLVRYSF